LLAGLIDANDPAYAEKWRNLPDGFRRTMLAGIMGFRIPIARIEGKFKLSQNRPEADRRSVYTAHAAGSPDQQQLAEWMKRLI
jgi:transcriptional regulator